ncbi:MAG TPA: helicase C-terminal domain-containing protein, partial [Candidatus Marinimicrobia bacterium]|nr:helicase C-terminal domain-containing protein [Candidatus Neomarinimicrobiota bacterium]
GKGILVLFTSYNFMYEVYQLCLPTFIEMGITLLAQGQGASRTALLEQFRLEQNSVLLGTDSFWEGVDVVGPALEILVITKLPFPVPTEPIIEANVEKLKAEGQDPFNEYYVPESVLKFRQGVGRLIRSINDVGVVINLDSRIDKKAYGRYFKKSLPVEPISIVGEDELLAAVRKFFRIGK